VGFHSSPSQYYHDPDNEHIGRYANYINQHADYFDEHINFDATIIHGRAKTNSAQTGRAAQVRAVPSIPIIMTSDAHDSIADRQEILPSLSSECFLVCSRYYF
jgi:hypothetical protein